MNELETRKYSLSSELGTRVCMYDYVTSLFDVNVTREEELVDALRLISDYMHAPRKNRKIKQRAMDACDRLLYNHKIILEGETQHGECFRMQTRLLALRLPRIKQAKSHQELTNLVHELEKAHDTLSGRYTSKMKHLPPLKHEDDHE